MKYPYMRNASGMRIVGTDGHTIRVQHTASLHSFLHQVLR